MFESSIDVLKGEQVDLFTFPPVCLPSQGQTFSGTDGVVAGELFVFLRQTSQIYDWVCESLTGWGLADTEAYFYSDVLQEAEVAFPGSFLSYLPILGPNHRKGRLQGEYGGEWTQLH